MRIGGADNRAMNAAWLPFLSTFVPAAAPSGDAVPVTAR